MVWDYFFISVDMQIQVSESVSGNKNAIGTSRKFKQSRKEFIFKFMVKFANQCYSLNSPSCHQKERICTVNQDGQISVQQVIKADAQPLMDTAFKPDEGIIDCPEH